jgi:hypothetical protein
LIEIIANSASLKETRSFTTYSKAASVGIVVVDDDILHAIRDCQRVQRYTIKEPMRLNSFTNKHDTADINKIDDVMAGSWTYAQSLIF